MSVVVRASRPPGAPVLAAGSVDETPSHDADRVDSDRLNLLARSGRVTGDYRARGRPTPGPGVQVVSNDRALCQVAPQAQVNRARGQDRGTRGVGRVRVDWGDAGADAVTVVVRASRLHGKAEPSVRLTRK